MRLKGDVVFRRTLKGASDSKNLIMCGMYCVVSETMLYF